MEDERKGEGERWEETVDSCTRKRAYISDIASYHPLFVQ